MKKHILVYTLIGSLLLLSQSICAQNDSANIEPEKNLSNQLKLGYGSGNLTTTFFLSYDRQATRYFKGLDDIKWFTTGGSVSYTNYDLALLEGFSTLGISSRFLVFLDELLKNQVRIPTIIQPYAGLKFGYELFLSTENPAFSGFFSSGVITQLIVGLNINLTNKIGLYFEIGGEQSDFNTGINIR